MDLLAIRVMRRMRLQDYGVHDAQLGRTLMQRYSESPTRATTASLIPGSATWWGSREQMAFLQVLAAILDLEDPLRDGLWLCPGPWNRKDLGEIHRHCHDELGMIAACIKVVCAWCKAHMTMLPEVGQKVHARMAARLAPGFVSRLSDLLLHATTFHARTRAALAEVER